MSFTVITSVILGSSTDACVLEQLIILWIAVGAFLLICFGTSLLNNSTVVFNNSRLTPFNAYAPVVHAIFACTAFLVLVLLNSSIFSCLFNSLPDDIVSRSVPIMVETLLVAMYSQLFNLPPAPTTTPATATTV